MSKSFSRFRDAIYNMHRCLIEVKKILKKVEESEEAKEAIVRELLDKKMEAALKEAQVYGPEWLDEIRKKASDGTS